MDLVNADITSTKSIEEAVTQIHQRNPTANMDDWIDGITEYNENFRSFILAGHLEHENFDVDVVMQVFVLLNIPVIIEIEQFFGQS